MFTMRPFWPAYDHSVFQKQTETYPVTSVQAVPRAWRVTSGTRPLVRKKVEGSPTLRAYCPQRSHAVDGNRRNWLNRKRWALNSAVECHPHTVEVVGSNPTAPTILQLTLRTCRASVGNGRSSGPGWPRRTPAVRLLLFQGCRPASTTGHRTAGGRFQS